MKIIYNHIGYNKNSEKIAIIESTSTIKNILFHIKDQEGTIKFTGNLETSKKVDQWKNFIFAVADFSYFNDEGKYYLEITEKNRHITSGTFSIGENLLQKELLSDLTSYFKTQRSSGRFDKTDHSIPFYGSRQDKKDVHGGWYDASGDMSKYLSHLSYANYMNPQHIPMAAWNLLESAENLKEMDALKSRMRDEAVFGADFLMRMQDESGYFYQTVFDGWTKELSKRMICSFSTQKGILSENYKAAFRQGGGVAIAALARTSALDETFGDYSKEEYFNAAEKGYLHLMDYNPEYLPDGEENIIDTYCALLASTELFRASKNEYWYSEAEKHVNSLCGYMCEISGFIWLYADKNHTRPFYHASDAGLPVTALMRLHSCSKPDLRGKISLTIRELMKAELAVTNEVANPFGYARQIIKPLNGEIHTSFFMPHENETGYWWQGENARLASLSAAALYAAGLQECADIRAKLKTYAKNQINWILGLNPFDICMVHGKGRNNPQYVDFLPNIAGGVCNGITSGSKNEKDIDFLPEESLHSHNETWRWSEQWIPHAAWLLLAISLYE